MASFATVLNQSAAPSTAAGQHLQSRSHQALGDLRAIYLVFHRDLRRVPRVRLVTDALEAALGRGLA
ncbi:MAG: hypothetical protein JJ863_24725 [Deltaproteobacteria bacterium]|nr:hypothetical protein [Deltaproteobacteria bacterium]